MTSADNEIKLVAEETVMCVPKRMDEENHGGCDKADATMMALPAPEALRAHWLALLLRGIVAVLFGVLCFVLTRAAIFALVICIGAFFIVDGVLMLIGAIRSASASHLGHWLWQLIGGIVGIAAGILTFAWPGITALTLGIFIGAWAIVTGAFELVTAIRLRSALPNEWLWVINGVLSLLFGLFVFVFPGAGLVAIVYVMGFYAILAGIAMITLSFQMKKAA
ncbi:MAG: HdeD family acid-resistance protein [Vulcanimicrobiaceae bacterium]